MSAKSQTNVCRDPSLRDREIHRQVKVGCRRQCQVAEQFGLSPGQVSRIVRRVQAWRGAQQPEERGELPYAAQQRVGRWLAQERAEEMYAEARRLVEETGGSGQEPVAGGRESDDGVQQLRRFSVRMQAIKTALKAAQEVYELSQAEPPAAPSPAEDQNLWREQVVRELAQQRRAAEAAGVVPKSPSPTSLVECLLRALVGGPQWLKPDGTHGPGTAQWQVAEALVSGSRDDVTLRAQYGKPEVGSESQPDGGGRQVLSTEYSVPSTQSGTPACEPSAQSRNLDTAELGASDAGWKEVANNARTRTYVADQEFGLQPAGAAPVPEKAEKLRAGQPAGDENESDRPRALAPEVGSPEWQVARAKWLAERDRRNAAEAARKIRERYEREAELREARAAAAARRHGIRSTEPWSLHPDA